MVAGQTAEGRPNFTMESIYLGLSCSGGSELNLSADALNVTLDRNITLHNTSDLFSGIVPASKVEGINKLFGNTYASPNAVAVTGPFETLGRPVYCRVRLGQVPRH